MSKVLTPDELEAAIRAVGAERYHDKHPFHHLLHGGKLNKGQVTDAPVKSQFGFHVIRLDDVREAQLPKLEEVKPQIAQQLQQQKLGKFQEDLRAKAKIE